MLRVKANKSSRARAIVCEFHLHAGMQRKVESDSIFCSWTQNIVGNFTWKNLVEGASLLAWHWNARLKLDPSETAGFPLLLKLPCGSNRNDHQCSNPFNHWSVRLRWWNRNHFSCCRWHRIEQCSPKGWTMPQRLRSSSYGNGCVKRFLLKALKLCWCYDSINDPAKSLNMYYLMLYEWPEAYLEIMTCKSDGHRAHRTWTHRVVRYHRTKCLKR